jgi:hypothetical protein
MRNLIFLCSALIYLCSGCESAYDGAIPESEPIPVINGVLYADSVLALNLSWSSQPNEKEFEPISGARFLLKKNGNTISSNYQYKNDGTYVFEDTCRRGDKYEVEVLIGDHHKLTSQTTVPLKPAITLTKTNQIPTDIFNLEVTNIDKDIHAFYIFLFSDQSYGDQTTAWNQSNLYCDSPFADPCNRIYDSWAPEGFTYDYESFVRIPVENLSNLHLQTRLASYGNHHLRYYVIAATKEYDLYFKGGYLQRSFDPDYNLPFTYQPIYLPSNITGGAGIFSGIDLSLFEFDE